MPIDPSIALQVQPLKLESPMNQLAMMGDAMKIGEMQRGMETQNKLRDLYSQGIDVGTPEGFKQVAAIDPKTAMALRNDALKTQELQGNIKKTGIEIDQKTLEHTKQKMADLAFNPSNENVIAHFQDSIKKGELTPAQANDRWKQISAMPIGQRAQFFTEMGMKVEQRAQIETTRRGQDLTHSATIRGQNLSNDPVLQGQIAEGRKIGEARAEGVIAPLKDARANLKALKTAGYDPLTGEDNVSALIKKSTSGAIETWFAGAYGAMPGAGATSGQEPIGKLASISKTLTLDLLDGKLGAGISNDDRTALEQRFGDMANSMVPADKRLAAWGEAKEIMRKAAMLPEPGAAAAPASSGGNKPSLNDIFNPKPKK